MKSVVIFGAVLIALFGFVASAASPNPSDHLAGKIIIAIAVGFILLAFLAPPKVSASIFFGSIALVIVAYKLPMSFWKAIGLAKESPHRQGSPPPADDSK